MFARRWDGSPLAFRKIRICLLNLLSLVTTRPATELLDRLPVFEHGSARQEATAHPIARRPHLVAPNAARRVVPCRCTHPGLIAMTRIPRGQDNCRRPLQLFDPHRILRRFPVTARGERFAHQTPKTLIGARFPTGAVEFDGYRSPYGAGFPSGGWNGLIEPWSATRGPSGSQAHFLLARDETARLAHTRSLLLSSALRDC